MQIPPEWRPLRIDGGWKRGVMMIGDAGQAYMQIKWYRPRSQSFNASRWLMRRQKTVRAAEVKVNGLACSEDFTVSGWIPEAKAKKGRNTGLWYGYSPKARLLLEVAVNKTCSDKDQKVCLSNCVPSLRTAEKTSSIGWSVFDVSFETPSDFIIQDKSLNLGDMALLFTTPDGFRLVLRQVYPSSLALSRKEMVRWLENIPFKERRRYRPSDSGEQWSVESFGRQLPGLIRAGRKRWAFPLGRCAPRWTTSAIAHDESLGRLLIAEFDSPDRKSQAPVEVLLSRMNWALLEDRVGP